MLTPNDLLEVLQPIYTAVGGLTLAMARASGMFMMNPLFIRLGLTGLIRTAVAFTLSLPLLSEALPVAASHSGMWLAALVMKEWLMGAILGLVLGLPFFAAEMAGEIVDLQRGSTMAQLVDPLNSVTTGVTAALFSMLLVTLFFASGSFLVMLEVFYHSIHWWPIADTLPVFNKGAGDDIVALLDKLIRAGLLLVAPLMIALLGCDIVLAYLARMSPQFHLFDLSLPIKNLLFIIMLVLYSSLLLPSLSETLSLMQQTVTDVRLFMGGVD